MIRLILKCRGSDYDGSMDTWYKTIEIENMELEKILKEKIGYAGVGSIRIVGQELLTTIKE